MEFIGVFIPFIVIIGLVLLSRWSFNLRRKRRREYYKEYLKSDAWKRKRYVVLKRDNWVCQYCGDKATEVHHKKYARINIGREPIKWLISICRNCHQKIHK
mgnify:CR=1 FL=1|jgi:5-methylcytosine-specific restriction endonuclease McrA